MLSVVRSAALIGIEAFTVEVEVDLGRGMMMFSTVGLPAGAVCESRTRVRSAMENSGFPFPHKRVIVNLAPAHIRKEGSAYDLPIALGILAAEGHVPAEALARTLIVGELSLDGRVRPVRGALALAAHASREGLTHMMVPEANAAEAQAAGAVTVLPVRDLAHARQVLAGEADPLPCPPATVRETAPPLDLAEVRGQGIARRALEVAAAGGHNLLLVGPPGAGKTMLARRLPSILPPLSPPERLEASAIASVAGLLPEGAGLLTERPFRAPHHSASAAAIAGGGAAAGPGEVSLAHRGVLYLDELPEFRRSTLEALRQPLEDGTITISRAGARLNWPCRLMLVASMNPCPCGYLGHPRIPCEDGPHEVRTYRNRVSGPLLDRIDLQVALEPVGPTELRGQARGEPSEAVAARVARARALQQSRYADTSGAPLDNAGLDARGLARWCVLDRQAEALLSAIMDRLDLSARAHDRILKVARTLADLSGSEGIEAAHIAEAAQYRQLDRAGRTR